jgi:transposase
VITIGVDPHKQSHTAAAVDAATGELLDTLTIAADLEGHERLRRWARGFAGEGGIRFALEDCRHVSGRLERELLARGERVVRVPPKLMGQARRAQREFGKSDPIDALAVARAAIREPGLPAAHLDPRAREIKLVLDHREDLVSERTAQVQRLRWHLHDVEEGLEPGPRALRSDRVRRSLALRLARREQTVQVRICRELLGRIGELTRRERGLRGEISERVRAYAPQLLELPGCAELTAAKLVAEIAGAERFRSDAQLARHSGCAPLEASSGKRRRHRLSRRGNRQLNSALHRIAITQARVHPEARAYLERKRAEGKSTREALRCLKRHLARSVWQALRAAALPGKMNSPLPNFREIKVSTPTPLLT